MHNFKTLLWEPLYYQIFTTLTGKFPDVFDLSQALPNIKPWWTLQGYRLYFEQNNLTSVQQVSQNKSAIVDTLTLLSKYITFLSDHPVYSTIE